MESETKREDRPAAQPPAPLDRERAANTRRAFLRSVGKKTLYVTPVVMTLTAAPAFASGAPSGTSCGGLEEACTVNEDCCTLNCGAMGCDCKPMGEGCTEDVNCCAGLTCMASMCS